MTSSRPCDPVLALLRRTREARGWTLDDLSTRVGRITAQQLAHLENGTTDLGLVEFHRLCGALGLDPRSAVWAS